MAAADDEWGDDTGVKSVPSRPGARPATQPGPKASARAALERINDLRDDFAAHALADKEALARIDAKLDEHSETLTLLRESAAETKATLTVVRDMRDELRHARKLELVKVEAEVASGVETQKHRRMTTGLRYKALLALIGVLGTGVGALVHYLVKQG